MIAFIRKDKDLYAAFSEILDIVGEARSEKYKEEDQFLEAHSVKFGKNTTTTIFSNSYTITHNSDGTKSVSWSVKLVTDISAGTLSKSGTLKLTNIPRTSNASLSASSLY